MFWDGAFNSLAMVLITLTTSLHAPMQVSGLKLKLQGPCSGPARKDLTSKIKKAAKDKINKDEKDFVFSA